MREIHRTILAWYRKQGRTLPWRNNPDPYHILISEIMLQQTQVSRVLEKFHAWIRKFPNISALAGASKRTVLTAWSGMGYNRRALNLHAAAQAIVKEHGGSIPSDVDVLMRLPGFGKYTASAVACFGFHKRVPLVDVNIRRVLSRWTAPQEYESDLINDKKAWQIAEYLLPPRAYYNWNQALMDFGATVCTAASPRCAQCPARSLCSSSGGMKQRERVKNNTVQETPRRIFRGRVVEFLRSAEVIRGRSFTETGKHLREDFGTEHHDWLADILHTLQADGMIDVLYRKSAVTMRDFKGNLTHLRIRLAQ